MGRNETEAAIQEARAGNPKRVNTVEELKADLHSDDKARSYRKNQELRAVFGQSTKSVRLSVNWMIEVTMDKSGVCRIK